MASSNPFLQNNRQQLSFFAIVNNSRDQPQAERNVFKTAETTKDQDVENNRQLINKEKDYILSSSRAPPDNNSIENKPAIHPPSIVHPSKDNAQLELNIDGYPCVVTKLSESFICKMEDTSSSNFRIDLP